MIEIYDVLIIGAGPAGMTAGLYCAQAGLNVIALEKEIPGGQLINIEKIEIYPGFEDSISGPELSQKMYTQAINYGLKISMAEAVGIEKRSKNIRVKTFDDLYVCKALIIASGGHPKLIGIPGEEKFKGNGVAYCAICEGSRFEEKIVAVAGGGDSGLSEALYLANIAPKVIVIEMMPELTAKSILQKRVNEHPKIDVICSTQIRSIEGASQIESIRMLNPKTKKETDLKVDGLLVRVGWEPQTKFLKDSINSDKYGNLLVNANMETSEPGIFAAGDNRINSMKQISSAVGDGTSAAIMAQKYLNELL